MLNPSTELLTAFQVEICFIVIIKIQTLQLFPAQFDFIALENIAFSKVVRLNLL